METRARTICLCSGGVESKKSVFPRRDFRRFADRKEAAGVVCSRHSNATRESMFHQRRVKRKVRFRERFFKVYSSLFQLFLPLFLRVTRNRIVSSGYEINMFPVALSINAH